MQIAHEACNINIIIIMLHFSCTHRNDWRNPFSTNIVGDVIYNKEKSINIKEALAHASYVVSFKMAQEVLMLFA